MATNNTYLEMLKEQLESVKADYHKTLSDETISKNTRHTKSYNLRKEIKRLVVIYTLVGTTTKEALDGIMRKDKNFSEAFMSIINPEDGGSKIVVREGDTMLDLIQANLGSNDTVNRIMKNAEKNGLKLDDDHNTFVRI